ncbi:MAG: bis(5'-nucleosyl)-tetraphosphatase (symmetrical) YqeK [Clostridia bacterium]|nr:bis(5'-nucleosyl)-tetraphosphatase (symmetrical) YqeK [Clostridia bacterium]
MYESINKYLKENLKASRYEHSISVANEAKKLASIYKEDEEKAYFTGLIHDCAKNMPEDIQLELIKKYNKFPIYDGELDNPALLHAITGAVVANREFEVNDKEILSAIRYHTMGRVNMSFLEKIIYIADLTEPLRSYPFAETLREMSYKNINKAIIMSIENTVNYLTEKKMKIQQDIYTIKESVENDLAGKS